MHIYYIIDFYAFPGEQRIQSPAGHIFNSLRPSDAYMRRSTNTIGSDNALSPGRRQAIIWTNAGILLIELLGKNFSKIFIEIHTFSFMKINLKISSAKWRPFVSVSMCSIQVTFLCIGNHITKVTRWWNRLLLVIGILTVVWQQHNKKLFYSTCFFEEGYLNLAALPLKLSGASRNIGRNQQAWH